MVSICANPGCGKPLHYLREGRIFVFDLAVQDTATGEKRSRHLEHYWLCGECSQSRIVTQDAEGNVQVTLRLPDLRQSRNISVVGAGC